LSLSHWLFRSVNLPLPMSVRKGWNVIFRLYGALEPWINKTWRLGEIELVL